MTNDQLMMWLMTAPPEMRARVEMLAKGDTSATPRPIGDARSVSQSQAARMLGVSRQTVVMMMKRKQIETVFVSGAPRILVRSIDAIAQGKDNARPISADELERRRERRAASGRKGAAVRGMNRAAKGGAE